VASIPIEYDAARHEGISADFPDRATSRSFMPVLLEHRSFAVLKWRASQLVLSQASTSIGN
jgi:hypothetical protein